MPNPLHFLRQAGWLALVLCYAAGTSGRDTSKLEFEPKPVAWVEKESCGQYRVRGSIYLCGLSVPEAVRSLKQEYKPIAGQTIWQYSSNRFAFAEPYEVDELFSASTVQEVPGLDSKECSDTCCCSARTLAAWTVDVLFLDEQDAHAFEEYLSDTLTYYLTYMVGVCSTSKLETELQACPKYMAKASLLVCGSSVDEFTLAVSSAVTVDSLPLLQYMQCNFPSLTSPQTLLSLTEGLDSLPASVSQGSCPCSEKMTWDIVAGFQLEEDADGFLSFITSEYLNALNAAGICNALLEQGKQGADAIYTVHATTRMCTLDDGSIWGVPGENGEYTFLIRRLRDGYSPLGPTAILRYMKQSYRSMLSPMNSRQLVSSNNLQASGEAWWCMDKLSTCCCANPVDWKVRAQFGTKQDADYFARYMSGVIPSYLTEVQNMCSVNTFKGLFSSRCQCSLNVHQETSLVCP